MANAVTADNDNSQKPITSYDELLSLFHESIKPQEKFRVGAEMEKFGVFANGDPVPYEGDNGVLALMKELAATGSWKTEAESEGGPLLALMRDGASITLEPGSQFELSGAPLDDVPPDLRRVPRAPRRAEAVLGAPRHQVARPRLPSVRDARAVHDGAEAALRDHARVPAHARQPRAST